MNEEAHIQVHRHMSKLSTGQGRAQTSNKIVVAPSYPRVKVGNDLDGFCYSTTLND